MPSLNAQAWGPLLAVLVISGCTTETIREVTVPTPIPSLCVTECPAPTGTPTTNGELAEAWAARGEAIACYKARQECVREMSTRKVNDGNK